MVTKDTKQPCYGCKHAAKVHEDLTGPCTGKGCDCEEFYVPSATALMMQKKSVRPEVQKFVDDHFVVVHIGDEPKRYDRKTVVAAARGMKRTTPHVKSEPHQVSEPTRQQDKNTLFGYRYGQMTPETRKGLTEVGDIGAALSREAARLANKKRRKS